MEIKIGPSMGSGKKGVQQVHQLGLDCMEVVFTYGVKMKEPQAREIGDLARELQIALSVHAPYYVNLASKESEKITASRQRILQSCEMATHLGARYIVFHAGFYQQRDQEQVYQMIKQEMVTLLDEIARQKWDVVLAPETTGKGAQFGTLDELLRLKQETGCHLCVDFAHLKARNIGKIDYDEVMKKLQGQGLIHAHFSGIEWTKKGESRHLLTAEQDIEELFHYLSKYQISANIINESPDPSGDAVKMKQILTQMTAGG